MTRLLTDCRVLMVDDEPANLELLGEFLAPEGIAALVPVHDARRAVDTFRAVEPDLVLLDLHMPHKSGFELLADLRTLVPPGDVVPIVVLTADVSTAARARALSEGAHDFLTKPLDGLEVRLRTRNLLRLRLAHEAQRRARLAAEQAVHTRELVLAVVAHDLRNPLTSIAMDTEMAVHLLPEEGAAAPARLLQRVTRTTRRMHALIEDLLDVSRAERGAFGIAPAPLQLAALMDEAEATLAPLARARDVTLCVEGGAVPRDREVVLDGARLLQALSNIVGNAVAYSPAGGRVVVTWSCGQDVLLLSVRDTGPGIAADELPLVFGEFWRGAAARPSHGLGLGLVIARAIVDAHGGTIALDSTVGEGTTVRLAIPAVPVRAAEAPPPPALGAGAEVRP